MDYGECPTEASPDRREAPERLSHSYEQDVCSYVSSFLANFARIDRASAHVLKRHKERIGRESNRGETRAREMFLCSVVATLLSLSVVVQGE